MNKRELEKLSSHLLVEGNDDMHVVLAIRKRFSIPDEKFGIVDCKGVSELLKQIPERIKNREVCLGILIDADNDLQIRWRQLQNILSPLGYEMPEAPYEKGTVVNSSKVATVVGIWIMPDNQLPGMLEDFTKILIPKEDRLLLFANKIIGDIQNELAAKFKPIHQSKALIHTWLAWQESPGTPMGLAITKSYLDHNHELCVLFVAWLNRLFNPNSEVS